MMMQENSALNPGTDIDIHYAPPPEGWEKVAHSWDLWRAYLVRSALQNDGIDAVVYDELTGGYRYGSNRSYCLYVLKEHVAAARGLIDELGGLSDEETENRSRRLMARFIFIQLVFYALIFVFFVYPIIFYIFVAPIAVYIALLLSLHLVRIPRALSIMNHLRSQGFDWINYSEAQSLARRLGRRAYRVPPSQEMELLPGYEPSVERLVEFMNLLKRKDHTND